MRATKSTAKARPAAPTPAGQTSPAKPAPAIGNQAALRILQASGEPLSPGVRSAMERRFGADLGGVRVHTGDTAAESAQALGARAYTVGRSIVFGRGEYAPGGARGNELLTHELTHALQQGLREPPGSMPPIGDPHGVHEREARQGDPRTASSTVIARDPLPADLLPPTRSFRQMWEDFEADRAAGRTAAALAAAPALVGVISLDDAIEHGAELAFWLMDNGRWDLAQETLSAVERAWWIRYVSIGNPPLPSGGFGGTGPSDLITRAQQEAAADRHEQARLLFSLAMIMLQMQLERASEREIESASRNQTMDMPMLRIITYSDIGGIIAKIRGILAFYPRLQRQALAAGDSALAAQHAARATALERMVRENYTLGGPEILQSSEAGSRVLTMEATQTTSPQGTGYVIHGANRREQTVYPLPGEPTPDELGRHPVYTDQMAAMIQHIEGQEAFLTSLVARPEIRREFGSTAIDMTDVNHRLRVWRVLYSLFQQTPATGCPTALCSLLNTMRDYLRNFTTHTEYNIPDFGVPSYIDTEMRGGFPTDLEGRMVADCGVYALTVAYEVYRTAREATPRLPVSFQVYQTLEHAMLVINDTGAGSHYVVNNDQITGPVTGDPVNSVALAYSGTMGRTHLISPAGRTALGDTSMTDAQFRRRAWQGYQTGAHLGLAVEPPTGPDDTRDEGQRRADTYTRYYEDVARFDRVAGVLDQQLDTLQTELAGAPAARHAALITARLQAMTDAGVVMARVFNRYAFDQTTVGLTLDRAPVPVERVALLTTGRTSGNHPLVRLGRALQYYQSAGGTLSTVQQALLQGLQRVPIPAWQTQLSGAPAASF